jgi:hypothetical protein
MGVFVRRDFLGDGTHPIGAILEHFSNLENPISDTFKQQRPHSDRGPSL